MKKLIVNADDFGYASGINKGIIQAYKEGIVTSTSLMIDAPGTREAVELAKANQNLRLGLHFVFSDQDNRLLRLAKQAVSVFFVKAAEEELKRQFEKFVSLVGKRPDHLDAHFHYQKLPRILPLFKKLAQKYKIPVRSAGEINFISRFSA